jgi:hypothetical protein
MFQYLAKSTHSNKPRHLDKAPKLHSCTEEKRPPNKGSIEGGKEAEKRQGWMLLRVNELRIYISHMHSQRYILYQLNNLFKVSMSSDLSISSSAGGHLK